MKKPQEQYELLCLILGAMDETLTREQFAVLDSRLRQDPEALAFYAEFMKLRTRLGQSQDVFLGMSGDAILDGKFWEMLLDDQIHAEAVACKVEEKKTVVYEPAPVKTVAQPVSKIPLLTAFASLAAFFVMLAYVHLNPKYSSPLVGQLTRTVGAQWANATGVLVDGSDLRSGPLHLIKGYAELYTENGTQVILEAPVELSLESPSQIILRQGKITVNVVRKDTDFVVRTPMASIVDFGTEFGVRVDDRLNTMTHVYQGRVELRSGPNPLRFESSLSLTQGEGGLADTRGELRSVSNAAAQFVRSDEFGCNYMAAKGSSYHRWKAASFQLRRDPDLVAYYTFEKEPSDPETLYNMASATRGALNGVLGSTVAGRLPQWQPGRWPEKTALAFDRRQGQYVEVPADARLAINGPITVAAWVYRSTADDGGHILANRISNDSVSRFSSESICNYQLGYRSPSPSHWKQSIHLARKQGTEDYDNQPSSPKLPDLLGWTLVAVTHDNETLKFYLNGNLVGSRHWPHKQELIVAELLIGTDFIANKINRFNGLLDEIVIARRVFSEQEIVDMYHAGKP